MKEKNIINWGIIGLGNIAHLFAKELQLVPGAQLVAVASRSKDNAEAFAKTYQCPKAYDSYEAILNDDTIDILYIATPHDSHAELTLKALEKNKHVLCEKPIALRYEDAEKMIAAAVKYNKFFMEAFWTRFNPSFRAAFTKIKQGEIGTIRYINADFAFYAEEKEGSRMYDLKAGGGSLMDIGVYPLFLAYTLLGIPESIYAKSIFHSSGVDTQTTMMLQYKEAQAVLYSGISHTSNVEATISGTKGRINLNTMWHMAESYTLIKEDTKTIFEFPTQEMGYIYEIEECHECIRNNATQSTLWSHKNSLELIQIVEEVKNQIGLKF
ncbi:Predicted dehydrogenase [Flavobacterium flevense]|uniref:Dehydrogenase n=1 Tax=Flavobacterium flevense TaxID=983 RepID=A0A4Y4AVN4_9FLAO|nr:Gfo/Idh/MocA family oxidoreductase [Flavobacterium flevense]GEC72278.1 dehydrogenase [Flavobacterium flevense]SHL66394.1 Predicted dehydrogenase [Flavobacterium flevense]